MGINNRKYVIILINAFYSFCNIVQSSVIMIKILNQKIKVLLGCMRISGVVPYESSAIKLKMLLPNDSAWVAVH